MTCHIKQSGAGMLMAGRLHRNRRVKWLWARSSSVDASDRQQLPRWTLFPSLTVATVERAATAAKRKRRRQKIEAATRTPSGTRQPKTTTRVLTWKVISLSSLHLFTFPPFRRFSWNTKKKSGGEPWKGRRKGGGGWAGSGANGLRLCSVKLWGEKHIDTAEGGNLETRIFRVQPVFFAPNSSVVGCSVLGAGPSRRHCFTCFALCSVSLG